MLRHDFNNPITVDAFWMRQVQPGTRLLVSFLGTLLISAIDISTPLLVLIACSFYLLLSRGVDWRWIVGHLTGLTTLSVFFALPLAWMGPGESSGPWGTRPDGVRLGIVVILKATAILTWSWVWLLGFGPRLWRQGAKQIYLPGHLAEVGWLMGNSIIQIRKELRQMRLALRLRGGRITASRQGYHLLANLLGMTLWRSSGHAEKITVAKQLRCEGPGESVPPLGWRQLAIAMLLLTPLAVVVSRGLLASWGATFNWADPL